ncbi:MAG: ABC transporter ATP-binding protein [Candidatus Eisenbacteria bacterium]|nr:ABC transporter ATP-binding protein [Candidatus Eisenbacteria bacterium]
MIVVEDLSKRFGAFHALRGVSFRVRAGEVVGFLGPNGAGKTTTLRILTGWLRPTAGRVRVAGHDPGDEGGEARRRIGYLPERVPLYPDMRVRGYLRFVAEMKGFSGREGERLASEALERCGADPVADRRTAAISHGFRQRVGLAQALLGDPDVLLLDEPTIGLDPEQAASFRALIRELAGERTILLSTHILTEAARLCGRVMILDEGELLAVDTPENLERALRGKGRTRVLFAGPMEDVRGALGRVPGVVAVEEGGREGEYHRVLLETDGSEKPGAFARAVLGAGGEPVELFRERMSLEEIYLRLTKED